VVRNWIVPLVVFAALFATIAVRSYHYLPAEISLRGVVARPLTARLSWDSGGGFNAFEAKEIVLATDAALRPRMHRLSIERLASRNPSSRGGEVWITDIAAEVLDRPEHVDLSALHVPEQTVVGWGSLGIVSDRHVVTHEGAFDVATITFHRHSLSGMARVSIDGAEQRVIDLYAADESAGPVRVQVRPPPSADIEPGPFERRYDLPRSRIRAVRIESLDAARTLPVVGVAILTPRGTTTLAVEERSPFFVLQFDNLPPINRIRTPLLLAVQGFVASIGTWAIVWAAGLRRRLGQPTWVATLRHVLVAGRRWVFWAMFAFSAGVFSLWLLAWWPGMMTQDSLVTWLHVKRLDFENWNPFVYTLYVLALTQLYDSPAIVAIFQLLATAALGSAVFFFVFARGVKLWWIAPFFVAFALSVPVAVYNLLIWKDVPFCLLTVFWAVYLYYLAYQKRVGDPVTPSMHGVVLLAGLFVMLCTVRHNGLIYLVVLPLMLVLGRLMAPRRLVAFLALSGCLYLLVQFGVGNWIGAHQNTNYRILRLSLQLNPWAALLSDRVGYYTDDPEGDRRTLAQIMAPDAILKRYNPLTVVPLVHGDNRREAISEGETEAISQLFIRRALENLHIVMAERAYLFFATLGYRTWAFGSKLWDQSFHAQRVDCTLPRCGSGRETVFALRDDPKSPALRAVQETILSESTAFRGIWRGSFVFWNAVVPLPLIATLFLLYKWLPLTALACAFVLVQVVVLFFTIISNDFRYVYFIHLFAYFVLPLCLLEIRLILTERAVHASAPRM
jgi:hypothetical protein